MPPLNKNIEKKKEKLSGDIVLQSQQLRTVATGLQAQHLPMLGGKLKASQATSESLSQMFLKANKSGR